ncbi:MAG: C40 family peptidase [Acidobacteria bacterium]|nr:C40 family peptidase [Acidobacteriota bacterium]
MLRLGLLAALCALSVACASTGAVPSPFPSPRGSAPPVRPPADPPPAAAPTAAGTPAPPIPPDQVLGYRIANSALEFRGVPYRNGGADPAGFDCSGLVAYVFRQYGRAVPRQTVRQFEVGTPVSPGDLRAGDLVFFSTVAPGASHVGIALDDDEFVHAPNSKGVVRVERLTAEYWRTRFIGARRVN